MNHSIQGWMPIASAILLITFWIFFAIFLPMDRPYLQWVLDANWIWINILGFIGSALGVFALFSIQQHIYDKSIIDHALFGAAVFGVLILTSILFFECFILKGIALENEALINLDGSFYKYRPFQIANLTGGILFSLGIIGMAIKMIFRKTFKKWSLILLLIGCPLFGIVLVPGNLRLLGVLLYSIAFISIGMQMLKMKNNDSNV